MTRSLWSRGEAPMVNDIVNLCRQYNYLKKLSSQRAVLLQLPHGEVYCLTVPVTAEIALLVWQFRAFDSASTDMLGADNVLRV
jgi:hypothetical protein